MISIKAIGGYSEVGRNCTALKIGNDVFLLDLGVHLENYIKLTDEVEDLRVLDEQTLIDAQAIPNLEHLGEWKDNLRMISPTHAHLDHVGAIPFMLNRLNLPVASTPYTCEVIRTIMRDEEIPCHTQIHDVELNKTYQYSKDIKFEFIEVTHSTPHTSMIAVHTPKGIILYANDFKFDDTPTLGNASNYARLKELGEQGVLALIADSTYARQQGRMPSEQSAKDKLFAAMQDSSNEGHMLMVTTFSSHIARLQAIIECAKKLNRKVIFLGRSLYKYVQAAENVNLVQFSKEIERVKFGKHIRKRFKQLEYENNKDDYVLVVTGHQGEPQSTLGKLASGKIPFTITDGDHIVFSCRVIPTPTNEQNRARLEGELTAKHARLSLDVHESGHGAQEDLKMLIDMTKPKHIIPAHGGPEMRQALADLAQNQGYSSNQVHLLTDGEQVDL